VAARTAESRFGFATVVLQDNSICNNLTSKVLGNQAFDEFNPFLGNNFIWPISWSNGCLIAGLKVVSKLVN
jgi:hypothetical protein